MRRAVVLSDLDFAGSPPDRISPNFRVLVGITIVDRFRIKALVEELHELLRGARGEHELTLCVLSA